MRFRITEILLCVFTAACAVAPPSKNSDPALDESQAKTFLASIYVSEVSFFDDHKTYTNDLKKLKITADQGFPLIDYWVGFPPQCAAKEETNSILPLISGSLELRPTTQAVLTEIEAYLARQKCAGASEFRAYAIGSIDGQRLDIWSIDATKAIKHLPSVRVKDKEPKTPSGP